MKANFPDDSKLKSDDPSGLPVSSAAGLEILKGNLPMAAWAKFAAPERGWALGRITLAKGCNEEDLSNPDVQMEFHEPSFKPHQVNTWPDGIDLRLANNGDAQKLVQFEREKKEFWGES